MSLTIEQVGGAAPCVGHLLDLFEQDVGMQVDDQDTKLSPTGGSYRRGNPNDGAFRFFDLAELDVQIEGGNVDLPDANLHRITKIIAIPFRL